MMTQFLLIFFAGLIDAVCGNGPLGNLNADAIFAGLKGDQVAADINNLADHAADRRDLIADAEAIAHLFGFLFLLVFRADHEEIEDSDQKNDHYD